jgi:hypothetical protein
MQREFDITEEEMLEALNKSGNLMESEIASILAEFGFFFESNQVIEDKYTGKSREIDLIAEYYNYKEENSEYNTASRIKFIFEIKNNLISIVLLTKWESSPNIEDWTGLKEALNIPEKINYDWYDSYNKRLIQNNKKIFTQYCSFQKKKANDELMALHPNNIHEGLSKITQYSEEMVKLYDKDLLYEKTDSDYKDEFFRHFLFMPVLLINDELFEFQDNKLQQVDSSILVYNYHFDKKPKMAYVFVVTTKGFPKFIERMIKIDKEVEEIMIKIKKGVA